MKTTAALAGPRYEVLLQLLRTADTIWNASRVFFARWDLSPSQFNILNLLHAHPHGLSQSELSRLLITHRSNVTGLVDRLEKRAWVERREVAADRRAYQVVLTRTGAALLKEILPRYYKEAQQVCGQLPPGRTLQFIADLQGVAQNAERLTARLPD
ncbi:MAG TPA: MarR family transcriptional regulator [Candidatus Binatia bacterium]|jgi:DNA-binding MarR family transcriptional regulator|nr:MarR family transcriptional regulator [Candidatus Binatia bacterium]